MKRGINSVVKWIQSPRMDPHWLRNIARVDVAGRAARFSAQASLVTLAALATFIALSAASIASIDTASAQGGSGSNSNPDECTPVLPRQPTRGLFVWKDCDGRWHARAGSVRRSGKVRVLGRIGLSNGYSNVTGYDVEPTDVLDTSDPNQILVDFAFVGAEYDGFEFDAPAGSELCVDLRVTDGDIPVAVGRSRRQIRGRFNPSTLRPCR